MSVSAGRLNVTSAKGELMFRACPSCGRTYATQRDVFNLYCVYAYAINRDAVIDANEEVGFCPGCGEPFPETAKAEPWAAMR